MDKIGLLPGTFDPIHKGHVELAAGALEALGLDEVWLLVNAQPQHKVGVLRYEDRLAMAGLAVKGRQGLRVYEGALRRRPQTLAMFLELMRMQPKNEFVFIVGVDNLMRLDTWDDCESVVKNATYAVARRAGIGEDELESLRRRLGPLGSELKVRWFDAGAHDTASSTAVRRAIAAGERPDAVEPAVYDYIVTKRLYQRS